MNNRSEGELLSLASRPPRQQGPHVSPTSIAPAGFSRSNAFAFLLAANFLLENSASARAADRPFCFFLGHHQPASQGNPSQLASYVSCSPVGRDDAMTRLLVVPIKCPAGALSSIVLATIFHFLSK